jgi:hypothetical protein
VAATPEQAGLNHAGAGRGRSPDDVQVPEAVHLVIDVLAHGQVEHAEAERGEHHRPIGRHRHPPGHYVVQGAGQELPSAGELLGQMR